MPASPSQTGKRMLTANEKWQQEIAERAAQLEAVNRALRKEIAECERTEPALREREELFRVLVEGIKDYAIFILDPKGCVTTWNSGAERIKGYKAEEIIGKHFSLFYGQDDLQRGKPEEQLKVAAALGSVDDEGWRLRRDGSRFWANVVITALKDEAGRLIGFAKITRDMSERKRADEALLLEITNTLVPHLDIRGLLNAISASICQISHCTRAALALCDPGVDRLTLQVLDSPNRDDLTPSEVMLPVKGSPAAMALASHKPQLLQRVKPGSFDPDIIGHWVGQGVKSACWLPLIRPDRVLGTLIVASEREASFTQENMALLGQVANQIALALDNALTFSCVLKLKEKLVGEKLYLEDEICREHNFEEIVGTSVVLRQVLKQAEVVATTDSTVLIQGETGTGKEMVARAIHRLSSRRERAFVKVNCAAIPSGLVESELVGHERGAFTGAIAKKIGRFELADEGTLFLDEVGDIPVELQPKLLRVLQEKEFERLGGTRTLRVNVRLIAATNRDLASMVKTGQFRSDLYYRLKVFPILVPPLGERPEDIRLLARYFVLKYSRMLGRRIETIPAGSIEALVRHSWPGNVRELENIIERAVILSPGRELYLPMSELEISSEINAARPNTLETADRNHILSSHEEANWVIAGPRGAAARLGLERTTLYSKMHKLGIKRARV